MTMNSHKSTPETKEMSENESEKGTQKNQEDPLHDENLTIHEHVGKLNKDYKEYQKRQDTNPNFNMTPAYMQDCITDLQKRIITLENFIGKNYKRDFQGLQSLVLGFENNFSAIPQICERIELLEKMAKDPFRHGENNIPDPDALSPGAFGVLLLRIENLERLADTINAHQKGAEDFVRKVSNELDQDLGISIERIEKLEERLLSPEHLANNFSQIIDKFLEPNITSLHKRIDELEQRAIKRIGILGNALNDVSPRPHKRPLCEGKGRIRRVKPWRRVQFQV
jgi:hypothetical protein